MDCELHQNISESAQNFEKWTKESLGSPQAEDQARMVLLFLNDITRNIIPSNGAEILLINYGYRVYPQAHGYTIVAFHPKVF